MGSIEIVLTMLAAVIGDGILVRLLPDHKVHLSTRNCSSCCSCRRRCFLTADAGN